MTGVVGYPREPEIRKTAHGLHLAITVILAVVSFGILGAVWACVWFAVAVGNDIENRRERRRYEREMAAWEHRAVQPLKSAEIGPFTHDVWLSHGIGLRTVKAITADTVTVNGRVEDETYPRSYIEDSYRRKRPAKQ